MADASHVSRETDASRGDDGTPEVGSDALPRTAPPAPVEAGDVFGAARLPLLERYAAWLADDGVVRGLLGPREAPRLWERHLLNCGVLERLVPADATVCDIGSGAGLPGLVLALARPDLAVTLVEPLQRRVSFLQDVATDLGVDVEIVRGRAESLHGRRSFDIVTSRAVAPLERLLAWSLPLVSSSGAVLALKGSSASTEVEDARRWLAQAEAMAEVLEVGSDVLDPPSVVVRVVFEDPSRVSWPLAPATTRAPSRGSSTRRRRTDSPPRRGGGGR